MKKGQNRPGTIRLLPWHPKLFLEDAHKRGALRQAGFAVADSVHRAENCDDRKTVSGLVRWHHATIKRMESTQSELHSLLMEWNPIGVPNHVDDEYHCLIAPLLSRLNAGTDRAEIELFLRHELVEHFGLSPDVSNPGKVADHIVSWWETRTSV